MSNNAELDTLKKLFSCSSEYVIIMDHDFKILWCSKETAVPANSDSLKHFFENEMKPLKSGEYFLLCNETEIPCNIINYSECGLYVLQTSGDDTIFRCMRSDAVRHFFSNQTGQLRETASGIVSAVTLIRNTLDEESLDRINDYLDIAVGKCRGILKAAMHPEELIKYIEEPHLSYAVELTGFLNEFSSICGRILKDRINISLRAASNLRIKANTDRLTVCMLSMIVLAGKNVPDCGQIFITADRVGDHVSVTVSSGAKEKAAESRIFSRFEKLYKDESSDPDLFVIHRFCRTFNGIFLIADNGKNKGKTYSMKLPFYNGTDANTIFNSEPCPYHGEQFSIYNIALSEISDMN